MQLVAQKNGHKTIDQFLVVDVYKGLVLDVAEKELIKLTLDCLRLCVSKCGLSADTEVQVAEAMTVVRTLSRNLVT